MINYETIFAEGYETSLRGSSGDTGAFTRAHTAAVSAVVAASKAEALREASKLVLGPSQYLRDASTCRQIATELLTWADEIQKGAL